MSWFMFCGESDDCYIQTFTPQQGVGRRCSVCAACAHDVVWGCYVGVERFQDTFGDLR